AGRTECRRGLVGGLGLSVRTNHGFLERNRGCAAVVADRYPLVVGQQRVVRSEHASDVRGVVDRRVEVGVVADPYRHVDDRAVHRIEQIPGEAYPAMRVAVAAQQRTDFRTQRREVFVVDSHQLVERGLRRDVDGIRGASGEQTLVGADCEIEYLVTDRYAAARNRFRIELAEYAERKILNREIAARHVGGLDPAWQRRIVREICWHSGN